MNQFYLNRPSVGTAISAEEFAAGTCPCPKPCPPPAPEHGCGCGAACAAMPSTGCGCTCGGTAPGCFAGDCEQNGACCQQMICCCRPAPTPAPQPPQVDEGCCCKQSFRAALGLLCDQQISSLLDFDASAFLTSTYSAGAALTCGKHSGHGPCTQSEAEADEARHRPPCQPCSGGASDNLGTLSGSFRRFAPCSCDLLDIDAELYTTGGKGCPFSAVQVSLCKLDAVAIQGAAASAEGDLTADEAAARNFRCVRQHLAQRLNPCGASCGESCCSCASDGRDCCCAAGLLGALAQNNLSRRVSLAAGLLVLQNVTLLGTVGNVLVLSND